MMGKPYQGMEWKHCQELGLLVITIVAILEDFEAIEGFYRDNGSPNGNYKDYRVGYI